MSVDSPRPERERWLAFVFALLLFGAPARAADSVVEQLEHAEIDWTAGAVIATGSGAPSTDLPNVAAVRLAAERAAKMDAYRHVLEALHGVKVTLAENGKARLARPEVRAQVEGVVQGCKVKDTRYYSDGGVDVVLHCPFEGGLATALMPSGPRASIQTTGEDRYTGLIVDVSGTEARPVLVPTLATAKGEPLFEPSMVSAQALRTAGGVVYVRGLEDATAHPRAGKNPLVVNVSEVHPRHGWIVEDDEAEQFAALNTEFLSEGRVVVVLPKETSP